MWAVVAFVLAAVMIGAGIAQRTVFQGPDAQTAQFDVEEGVPYVLIDGGAMTALPGPQTLRVQGEGELFAAYGRTADLEAWLADAEYAHVTADDAGEIATASVEPAVPESTSSPEAAEGEETADEEDTSGEAAPGRDPVGSDLWLDEFQQEDLLIAPLQLPAEMSVLVATDGTDAAPTDLSVSWPIENGTPWAGPLIVGGAVLMAVGLLLYGLGIRHVRRSRGPRRKGLPLPATEPIDVRVDDPDKGVISATPARRALGKGRKSMVALPVVAVTALALGGCSADAWPDFGPTPTPSPTASVIVPEGQQAPAVTRPQAERILERVAATVAEADEAHDPDLAATRLSGAPLAERETLYTLQDAIDDREGLPAIPTTPLEVVLPQATDGWPRTFLAVVNDPEGTAATTMFLRQQDPWSDYTLEYYSYLEADTTLPDLAPVYVGATQVQPDSPFLILEPQELSAAYADIINNGEDSEYASLFELDEDQFRIGVAADRQKRLDEFNETAESTGELTFSTEPGAEEPAALATLESGAIVAVTIEEIDTVKATDEDAVIKLDNNPTVQTLTGVDESSEGFSTVYVDQLFFYVPGQGSSEKIRLLGYVSNILDAKVIE
ncbi:glycosyl transferase [Microbacterium xanthum]|uniref:glycosyl transferase n=1 Tax=Microbacterium xanthum TaxID=3079794 RepID=UPI002AD43660|nr:glycosyl transferase [Microbacterium sp. KSW-48]MDZ8172351.1 glycosyl transferase [Microbacterium sp. KSW-48]